MVYYKENKLLIDLAISERQSCFESFTDNWMIVSFTDNWMIVSLLELYL